MGGGRSGRQVVGAPKSAAGNRVVVVPEVIIPAQLHLRWLAQPGEDGLLFTSPEGKTLRYDNFRHRVWYPALAAAGLPRVHFHDLRHTGNQLAADAGASLRELMDRMGHSTARAAMIYLHGSDERQRAIADAISRRAASEFKTAAAEAIGHTAGTERRPCVVKITQQDREWPATWAFGWRAWQDSNPRPAA